jgi:hypothetical protein
MSLTVNRTEEKEFNWADLIDGLRYGGFRRSVSARDAEARTPGARDTDDAAPTGGAAHKRADPGPS